MQDLPHRYAVATEAQAEGDVTVQGMGLDPLLTAAPAQFGGPGDRWSPETLLVAAVAGCFVLTFRAVARASRLPWTALSCQAEGVLNRVDNATQFTDFIIRATLRVPPGSDTGLARRALDRAERSCLIANSLKATSHLEASVEIG